jgi:hypothetical protein
MLIILSEKLTDERFVQPEKADVRIDSSPLFKVSFSILLPAKA